MSARSDTARRLQPKDRYQSPSSVASSGVEPKSKRRCVATACIPCRKRKSKCDGGLPKCSTCIAVYKTDCTYDPNAAETTPRKSTPTGLKRASTALQQPTSAEYLVQRLLSLPESEAIDAVYQLRMHGDVDTIAETLRRSVKISDEPPNVEGEHAHVKGDVSVDQKYRYGFTSGLGLVPNDDDYNTTKPPDKPTSHLWTDVTTDSGLVHHLIKLYFTWSNHFYPIVSEGEFFTDFANGRTEACSVILVNAMCAHGAVWTQDPDARSDPNDPRTSGDLFYHRARQLLFKDEVTPRMTTVQALQIMSMREACNGRVSSGFRYAGWGLNMAIELGMHLDGWKSGGHEDVMRRRAFWAMFNCDTAWSICSGRVAMLPRAAIEIEKPKASSDIYQWQLYDDGYRDAADKVLFVCHDQEMLYQQSSLTELLSEMLVIYYAPRERLSSRRILDLYARFLSWYKELPDSMHLSRTSAPNVFMLHTWYWTCVNHLFRPIVRMKLVNSNVQPREICIDTAIEISRAMDMYRSIYPMTTVNLLWCHVLLTAGLTHVFDLPSKDQHPSTFTEANHRALKDTAQCLRDFASIAAVHRFSFRGIQILLGLAEKYGLLLLDDVVAEVSPLIARKVNAVRVPLVPPSATNIEEHVVQKQSHQAPSRSSRTASRGAAGHAEAETALHMYSHTAQQENHAITYVAQQNQMHPMPTHPVSTAMDHAPSYPTSLFFTPVDGAIGIPLYHNNPSQSHMDLNVMLGAVDWPEQLRQDGFELSDVWGTDPMAGTNQQVIGGHQTHDQHKHHVQHSTQHLQSPQQRYEGHNHAQQDYGETGRYINGWT